MLTQVIDANNVAKDCNPCFMLVNQRVCTGGTTCFTQLYELRNVMYSVSTAALHIRPRNDIAIVADLSTVSQVCLVDCCQ